METPKWGAESWSCSSSRHKDSHSGAAPDSTPNDQLIPNRRLGPLTFFIAHFRCFQNFQISLHVELIPKASPTENKQRQQTPPCRKAVYQVLRAKFPTSQENKRRATRNCTVAQAAKRLRQQPQLFLQPSQKRKHWLAPRMG